MTRIVYPVQASNDRIPRDEMQLAYAIQNMAWDLARDKPARRLRRTPKRKAYPLSPRARRRRAAQPVVTLALAGK